MSSPFPPAWAKAGAGSDRDAWDSLSVPSLPDLGPHHPVASTEVLQGTSCSLQGVEVPALREEGEVETHHLGLVQQLKAWGQSTSCLQSPRLPHVTTSPSSSQGKSHLGPMGGCSTVGECLTMAWPPKRKSSPTSWRNKQRLSGNAGGLGDAVLPLTLLPKKWD